MKKKIKLTIALAVICSIPLFSFAQMMSVLDIKHLERFNEEEMMIYNHANLIIKGEEIGMGHSSYNDITHHDFKKSDYRFLVWSRPLRSNIDIFDYENITKKLKLEFVNKKNSRDKITYTYRDCSSNLVLEIDFWPDYNKVVLGWQWFDNSIRNSVISLKGCRIDYNTTFDDINNSIKNNENKYNEDNNTFKKNEELKQFPPLRNR